MLFAVSTILALLPAFISAQTSTLCNPTEKSCPADPGFPATTVYNFQQTGLDDTWDVLGSADMISQDGNGLHFTIDAAGQAPTITTKQYVFFGTITATLEAAAGAGIVSAFILQSDDLDEIDWEWLGGDTADVQSNYFSKGNTSSYDRGATHAVANPQTTFHTYTLDWSETELNWIIDGTVVRTLTAASVGGQFPQTPMQVRLGTWCGGCSGEPEGTVEWAGGPTSFSDDPYIMTITSLQIDNANPGGSYVYSDMSGSASSITIGGSVSLPSGNDTIGAGASSEAVSLSQISVSAQSSSSAPASSSSAAVSSTTTTSSTDLPTTATGGTQTGAQPITATTVNVGPTASTLPPNSEASRPSMSGFALFVLGAILLLAQ